MKHRKLPSSLSTARHLSLSAIAFAVLTTYAHADGVTDIGNVSANGTAGSTNQAAPASKNAPTPAAAKAITQAPLSATSPQSQISSDYIHNQMSPVADYSTIVLITPSYAVSSPNGPGLSEGKDQTLRGFPDGQFNVTYDGIPFGDTNDFTHHTTSYFPASTIGSVTVDRSPGNATTLGYATFGGSINMFSPTLSPTFKFSTQQTYGSNNTWVNDFSVTTGIMPQLLDSNLFIDISHTQSDGALTNGNLRDDSIFVKDITPLGNNTVATIVFAYDKIHFNNPDGTTLNQVAQFGYNYGLNNNPKSPDFYGYNYQDKNTDFGYIDLKHTFSNDWVVDNKLYTYYYYNLSHELDGDTTSSPLSSLKTAIPYTAGQSGTDIAGALKLNEYTTVGDTISVSHADDYGTFTGGLWFEHTQNSRNRYAVDDTTDTPYSQNATYKNVFYNMVDQVNTAQVFAQYAWKATSNLTVTPGIREQNFERTLFATENQNNLPGTNGDINKTWDSFLPSLDANYRLSSLWSAYAQIAKGSLAPNLNTLYSANPTANNEVAPQTSLGYQIGTVLKADRYTFDADVYLINFNNYITKTGSGANATFFNAGGVRYTGAEVEGNVLLGAGFSLYGNASLNKAVFTQNGTGTQTWLSGQSISFVPKYTAAVSLNYDHALWHANLTTKFVGSDYQGSNGAADGSIYQVGGYSVTNMSVAREFINPSSVIKTFRVTVGLDNLFNTHAITDNLGAAASDTSKGTDPNQFLYYFVPGRSVYITLRADI